MTKGKKQLSRHNSDRRAQAQHTNTGICLLKAVSEVVSFLLNTCELLKQNTNINVFLFGNVR